MCNRKTQSDLAISRYFIFSPVTCRELSQTADNVYDKASWDRVDTRAT